MRFGKTRDDIEYMRNVSGNELEIAQPLNLMKDIMEDVMEETGRKLSELDINDEAISPWIAVAGFLIGADIENAAEKLSERRKNKIEELRGKYGDAYSALEKHQADLDALEKEEKALLGSVDELEKICAEEQSAEQRIEKLRKREAELRKKADALSSSDEAALRKVVDDLEINVREAEICQSKIDAETAKLEKQKEKRTQLNNDLSSLENQTKSLSDEIADILAQTEAIKTRKDELDRKCETVRTSKVQRQTEYDIVNDEYQKIINDIETQKSEKARLSVAVDEALCKKTIVDEEVKRLKDQKEKHDRDYNEAFKMKNEYEKFFDSEKCHEQLREIEALSHAQELYGKAIQELLRLPSVPPVSMLGNFTSEMEDKRSVLTSQMNDIRSRMENLSKDYLEVISKIESEVR